MKFKEFILTVLIIFIFFTKSSLSKENKILLKVNNEIITTVDILSEIRFLSILNKDFNKIDKKQQIQIAKNSLIKDKIKKIELLKFKENLDLDKEDFEKIIKNYFFNLEIEKFKNYELFFINNNLDIEHVREKISIDTFWKSYIYQKFHKKIKINESEIKNSVLNKNELYEYSLSEIVFNLEKNEKLNQKIKKIKKIINEQNFAKAALNFSISETAKNGGKLGWIKENILNKKIRDELRNINKGEYTNPIVIPGGFMILNKENVRVINNDVDKDKEIKTIIEKQTNDQLNKFSVIYLNKLKKNIQINEI